MELIGLVLVQEVFVIKMANQKGEIRLGWVVVFIIAILLTAYLTYMFTNRGNYAISTLGVGSDDKVITSTVNWCEQEQYFKTELDKIKCVNQQVQHLYKYSENYELITPDKLIQKGGQCYSWTNFYKVILDRMNIQNKVVTLDGNLNHMFIIAYTDEDYCVLDGENMDCNGENIT